MAECVIIVNSKIRALLILPETWDCGDLREVEARIVVNGMATCDLMRLTSKSTRRGPRPFDELFLDRRALIISSDALLIMLLKRLNPVYSHPLGGFFFRIQIKRKDENPRLDFSSRGGYKRPPYLIRYIPHVLAVCACLLAALPAISKSIRHQSFLECLLGIALYNRIQVGVILILTPAVLHPLCVQTC